jgi:hypothetical protein
MKPTGPTYIWLVEHEPFTVVRLHDEVIDAVGHSATHAYVERFWLPIIGPTSVLALRRIATWLDASPAGVEVSLGLLAGDLGIGQSPAARTLARLVGFELAAITPADQLAVRTVLPPLPRRLTMRLPSHLAAAHDDLVRAAARPAEIVTDAA